MAYNPNLYNPYGSQQFQPTISYGQSQYAPTMQPVQQQAVNGLSFIDDIGVLDTLQMPPGSVSQPYFLKDEDKFVIVTFDNVGGSTKELFSFTKEPIAIGDNGNEFVTREYFDSKIDSIMEALNGKHAIPTAAEELATARANHVADKSGKADQAAGTV